MDFLAWLQSDEMAVYRTSILIIIITFGVRWLLDMTVSRVSWLTTNVWGKTVWKAIGKPIKRLILCVGIGYVLISLGHIWESDWTTQTNKILVIVAIFLVAQMGFRLSSELTTVASSEEYKRIEMGTADTIHTVIRIIIVVIAGLSIMQALGMPISGLAAFGGAGGLAAGFAAKDLLANFFGSIIIRLDRPFTIGDWIRSPDQNIEGTVENIGLRVTRIRTFDQRPLYVPNATFTTISVENPSRMRNRRIYESIGLRYEDKDRLQPILSDIRLFLQQHPEIDQTRTLMVNFNGFGASSLDIFIYCFTKTVDWVTYHKVKESILLDVYGLITKHHGDIAFPTQTLHIAEPNDVNNS